MRKLLFATLMFWGMGAVLSAAVLQDWSTLDPSKDAGTFTDSKGSKVSFSLVPGPSGGQKAIQINTNLSEWGGVWAILGKDLSKVKALKFKAKSSAPTYLMVGLNDDQKVQFIAYVKITSADWSEFVVPLSVFQKTPWPQADAPKDASLHLAKIDGVTLQPQNRGALEVSVGPLSGESGKVKAVTGLPSPDDKKVLVQDFSMLDKDAYGSFADVNGSKINLSIEKDGGAPSGRAAQIKYSMMPNGWCGLWMRAGDRWGGQDWTGAKRLTCKVYSTEPLYIEFGFNDANQNAYVAHFPQTHGKGWETLSIPFEKFDLNEFYQPPEAKKDLPQDLSHIETFNIAPHANGDHVFQLGELAIER